MPNGEGPKLVEKEDGIEAMERFQFHENEDLRNMANGLVDTYFGEDYGLDEAWRIKEHEQEIASSVSVD